MPTPLTAFGAGPRAYALVAEATALPENRQKLLLVRLAEHHPEVFIDALELVMGLDTPAAVAS